MESTRTPVLSPAPAADVTNWWYSNECNVVTVKKCYRLVAQCCVHAAGLRMQPMRHEAKNKDLSGTCSEESFRSGTLGKT